MDPEPLRCAWATSTPEYIAYHDEEWGTPLHGDDALFERVCLEAFQSGLSWITILRKRPAFRAAFAGFDIEKVAAFDADDEARLMADAGHRPQPREDRRRRPERACGAGAPGGPLRPAVVLRADRSAQPPGHGRGRAGDESRSRWPWRAS